MRTDNNILKQSQELIDEEKELDEFIAEQRQIRNEEYRIAKKHLEEDKITEDIQLEEYKKQRLRGETWFDEKEEPYKTAQQNYRKRQKRKTKIDRELYWEEYNEKMLQNNIFQYIADRTIDYIHDRIHSISTALALVCMPIYFLMDRKMFHFSNNIDDIVWMVLIAIAITKD